MAGFDELGRSLQQTYGPDEGLRVFRAVVPGILADFAKMLEKAPAGARVREEYILEDGRGSILLGAWKDGKTPGIEAEFRIRTGK